ncbi:MAG: S8 family serine peptidase [Candidatus Manganitrophus sp. SA1]|nr:S8 family serine peptidase [Candidatus Manganitrophus morganii]
MQRDLCNLHTPAGRRLFFPSYFIISLLIGSLALAGCNGGGGGSNNNPPVPTTGTASGKLTIPPDNTVEAEPNDEPAQAQAVSNTLTVSGNATFNDPSFFFFQTSDGVDHPAPDLFRLTTSEPVRITLSIGANDLDANDLDLVLFDASTQADIDISAGLISTELIEITPQMIQDTGGDFLVGVIVFSGQSAYVLDFASVEDLSAAASEPIPPGAEFVPGEVLVKLKRDASGGRRKSADFAVRHGLTPKQSLPQEVELMQVIPPAPRLQKGTAGSKSKLKTEKSEANELKALMIDTIRKLRRDPDVVYAEPNFIRKPFDEPNDIHFPKQWHYELINLPQAWDTTIGSNDIVVAVLDTGVLFGHPDLGRFGIDPDGRLIDGFDFISDPESSGDPDGVVDSDATDVGDDPRRVSSSFHGTHVAGTIGAATNNGSGVAGVTWETKIMPLRVLGRKGGSDADIAQAILYAAGGEDEDDPKRAHIINMSLGGQGFSQTMQNAINKAREKGVIVVAAAGNENTSALTSPAGLDGVISVSAVDLNATKAPYSNFGSRVDVAAPGGNSGADLNGDGFQDGVLSTLGTDSGQFNFRFLQGTSMAAPHVAGVIALMLDVNPTLTPTDIDQLLAGTHPGTTQRITRDLGATGRDDLYGHGLIDAALAVQAAGVVQGGGTPATAPILSVSTASLDFNNYINTLQINITNPGIGTLNITEITDDAPWLTVTPTSGTAPLTVIASVDRTGLADGDYTATITITSDAPQNPTATVSVQMTVGGEILGNVGTVFVLVVDEAFETVSETATSRAQNYAFTLPETPAGTYTIVAGTDRDDDGFICDLEDACGSFPEPVTVTAGEERSGIEILVGDLVSPQRAKAAPGGTPGKKFRRLQ